jgi:EpsI family protein
MSALIALMLIVGALSWYLRLGAPQLQVDASPLADLPTRIGPWRSTDIPLDAAVESELRADFQLQRAYLAPTQEPLWLYVGYYGTRRGGRPEHTPRGCYTGAGWGIESSQTLEIDPEGDFRVNEYLVEQDGHRRLVQFWYRSHRRTGILGGLDQNIDRLLGRLLAGRADGALIRISTPIYSDDTTAARSRLRSFASLVDPMLGEHWPIEFLCNEADPKACSPNTGPEGEQLKSADERGDSSRGAASTSSHSRIPYRHKALALSFTHPGRSTP